MLSPLKQLRILGIEPDLSITGYSSPIYGLTIAQIFYFTINKDIKFECHNLRSGLNCFCIIAICRGSFKCPLIKDSIKFNGNLDVPMCDVTLASYSHVDVCNFFGLL